MTKHLKIKPLWPWKGDYPPTLKDFEKIRESFGLWLIAHGSAVLAPTNPYEVMRFMGANQVCVIYRNEGGRITHWGDGAASAWIAFSKSDNDWRATQPAKRDRKTIGMINSLVARDGWGCAYCPRELTIETATLEHIVAVVHGGTSHLANLTLTCEPCNKKVGHLSAREKMEIAIRGRP